jgi:hypothetical protein
MGGVTFLNRFRLLKPAGYEILQRANADRTLPQPTQDTSTLTKISGWANQTADRGQRIGVNQQLIRALEVLLRQSLDEPRDIDVDRTSLDTRSVITIEATLGFEQSLAEVDQQRSNPLAFQDHRLIQIIHDTTPSAILYTTNWGSSL